MEIGDTVKWRVSGVSPEVREEEWSGWGMVVSVEADGRHVMVEVNSFPQWLGQLDGKFHPLIRCAVTWLTPFSGGTPTKA